MQLWIAGQIAFTVDDKLVDQWQLIGVFDSKDKAIAACKKREHFIAPLTLNHVAPEEETIFPGVEFPLA